MFCFLGGFVVFLFFFIHFSFVSFLLSLSLSLSLVFLRIYIFLFSDKCSDLFVVFLSSFSFIHFSFVSFLLSNRLSSFVSCFCLLAFLTSQPSRQNSPTYSLAQHLMYSLISTLLTCKDSPPRQNTCICMQPEIFYASRLC